MNYHTTDNAKSGNSLDLLSTSPTDLGFPPSKTQPLCNRGAPYFAYQIEGGIYGVTQGCCNSWICPRCGIMRAKEEYGRIIEGCKSISEKTGLRFITITTRGRDLKIADAERQYLEWTNRLLDAMRQRAKRSYQEWHYVQVTERQKRRHPHSHILTTFDPLDLCEGTKTTWQTLRDGGRHKQQVPALRSAWFAKAVVGAGLGEQYDVSIVATVAAASRYVAKYLFKNSMLNTDWPKGWKRVRYSQNFPKLPERKSGAFILMSAKDWFQLACDAEIVRVHEGQSFTVASQALAPYPVKIINRSPVTT